MQKQTIFSVILTVLFLFSSSCRQQNPSQASERTITSDQKYQKLTGETMGTTWHVTYKGGENQKHKKNIDSLLIQLNNEVSTYIPSAIISQFNQSEKGVALDSQQHAHFIQNYEAARQVYEETKGQFDPTIMPLVNYWGFGFKGREQVKKADEEKVKSLLENVGMDQVVLTSTGFLSKDKPPMQLDFSALAKGYGVDEMCRYFDKEKVSDYYVEIGGEVRAKGKNPTGVWWAIGISRPEIASAQNDFYFIAKINNKALATSGNYRNVYLVDDVHYFHTIDPLTGFPKRNRLLSASVFAETCMMADAYATAFMVMGLEGAMQFANAHQELEVCFIFNTEEGEMDFFVSEGQKNMVTKLGN